MEVPSDFKELLALLNENNVDYVVIGGYALAYHGAPRYTGALDILVPPDALNGRRICQSLADFGFSGLGLSESDFASPNAVIQLGYPPVRIDLATSIDGVTWEEVRHGSIESMLDGMPVRIIGRAELIANKRASARAKDFADLEALGEGPILPA